MTKTFLYCLAVIAVYLLIIAPKEESKSTVHESSDGSPHGGGTTSIKIKENKEGVATGKSGQLKYRIGHTN